jgi:hypothetical protein
VLTVVGILVPTPLVYVWAWILMLNDGTAAPVTAASA